MKKFSRSVLGVTLLEIMLVLAIAAMIIVMSVRYYQSATANQQANAALQMVQGVTAAADSLAQATGSYSSVNKTTIESLMPNRSLTLPWGATMTVATGAAKNQYDVTIPNTPGAVCTLLVSRLKASKKYSNLKPSSACAESANTVSYTYDSQL